MPYVMVPVPEEHIEAALKFVMNAIKRDSIEDWDESSIADLLASLDEASQVVLTAAAGGVVGSGAITTQDAAEAAGISTREAAAIVRELNVRALDLNRPLVILLDETEREGDDGARQVVATMTMAPQIAKLVHDADRLRGAGDGGGAPSAQDVG